MEPSNILSWVSGSRDQTFGNHCASHRYWVCCRPGGVAQLLQSVPKLGHYTPGADSPANPATSVPIARVHAKPSHWEAAAAATLAEVKGRRHRGFRLEYPSRLQEPLWPPPSPRGGDWEPELTAWAAPPLREPRSAAHTAPSSRPGPPTSRPRPAQPDSATPALPGLARPPLA